MPETLIRSFSSLRDAEAARDALLAQGTPAPGVALKGIEDEAGPVEGNFIIGNGATNHGGPPAAVRSGGEVPYDDNFLHTVHRGAYLLMVQVESQAEADRLGGLLEAFNAATPRP